jgi:hypothetical protein
MTPRTKRSSAPRSRSGPRSWGHYTKRPKLYANAEPYVPRRSRLSPGSPMARFDERIGLIWSDPVNAETLWGCFVVVSRVQSEQQPGQVVATIDQSDIRGSEPHNHDPSGSASDCYRESGRACRIGQARILLRARSGSPTVRIRVGLSHSCHDRG